MPADLPHAIFFDLDDTLIDDSANVESGWMAAIQAEITGLDGTTTQAFASTVLEVRRWYWSDPERHRVGRADLRAASTSIVQEALRRHDLGDTALAGRVANTYRDLREASRSLMTGAVETLEIARASGISTALLTNGDGPGQLAKIAQFQLEPHFDYICIEGEFGVGKPDKRVYQAALRALNTQPETAWMVGDNLEWDVAAPMRLGITGIWLDRFKTGLPDEATVVPDRIIKSVVELL